MQIVVHVDAGGAIVDVHTPGLLRLYDDASGEWREAAVLAFRVEPGVSLAALKKSLRALAERLGECRTFVSGENRGLVISLLQDEYGFRAWKSGGAVEPTRLSEIARMDAELARAQEKDAKDRAFVALVSSGSGGGGGCSGGDFDAIKAPRKARSAEAIEAAHSLTEQLGEGRLRLDLEAVLTRYRQARSVDVLEPILEARRFSSLEILCDHLPKWFEGRAAALDLSVDVTPRGRGLCALVSPHRPQ